MDDGADSSTTEVASDQEMLPFAGYPVPGFLPPSEFSRVRLHALLIVSGRPGTCKMMQQYLKRYNFIIDVFHPLSGTEANLTDDAIWEPLHRRIPSGAYHVAILAPPDETFSNSQSPPLRSITGREAYGLPGLDKRRVDQLRVHNRSARRTI